MRKTISAASLAALDPEATVVMSVDELSALLDVDAAINARSDDHERPTVRRLVAARDF